MSRRVLALIVLAVLGIGAAFAAWVDSRPSNRTVAIVNTDEGVSVNEEQVRAGEKIVEKLSANDAFGWAVVTAEEAAAGDYFATVTVPADFSDAVASVWGTKPRQASLGLDVAGADTTAADELSALVTAQIGAEGVSGLLTEMSSSRTAFAQATTTASFLAAGTSAADDAAQQLTQGADTLLPYLATARSGAIELLEVADRVAEVVDNTSGTANDIADRLSGLGLTLGQATEHASQMQSRVDDAVRVLRMTPIPPEVVASLDQVSKDLGLMSTQLRSVPELFGGSVGADTDLGDLVREAMTQLSDASAQLSSGARQLNDGVVPIADQAPEMLEQATTQIVDGFAKLKALSGQLAEDLGSGVAAMPAHTAAQQARLATVLAAPVAVTQTDYSSAPIVTAQRVAMGFGVTMVLLAGAVVWLVGGTRRGAHTQP